MVLLVVTVVAALLVGLPWLVVKGPYVLDAQYINEKTVGDGAGSAGLVTGLRTALVACVAAIGAGVALLYTARTYRLNRRGQITERFTKALERLGSEHQYVRIGGILALEQITRDAPEQAATDAARVLNHFIRDKAPKAAKPDATEEEAAELPKEPAADIQAALTALTRTESRTHVDPRERLDLQGLHLAGARLAEADLAEADLEGATLTDADLEGATLTSAFLLGAMLNSAGLKGADLTDARMQRATLTDASLIGADLTSAYLKGATLTDADLIGADLTGAYLKGATLTDTDLDRATLTNANLKGVDFTGSEGLTAEQINAALTDDDTILPDYLRGQPASPSTSVGGR
ncbi:pentapeptide repeat-containing protein [Streptomyces sp. 5K101]|uniref:pentapeptide repeat-containing protein n=1 Tax=Streptomyces sp. 5K101 TaxID=3390037 RepID=UPI0039750880